MRRRDFVGRAALAAAAISEPPAQRATRPNIVFVLADDLGWADTTPYGSRFYRTPSVERLASRGMLFTQASAANPLCSPTRASILTGQYPARLRLTTPAGHLREEVLNPGLPERGPVHQPALQPGTRTRLPLETRTLAEELRDAGYRTLHLGKWHLGWPPYHPEAQGFDRALPGGSYPGPPSCFAPYRMEGFADGPSGEHIDERLTEEAVRFFRASHHRPFFLNFWMFSVHAPFQAKPALTEQYRARARDGDAQRCPVMGAMIETMDACLGRLLDTLDETGLARNTIVVFTSDNGGNMYDRPGGDVPTSNLPLRGGKANITEGGVRVPLIVAWPGVVRPGTRTDAVTSSIDHFPTLLAAAGLRPSTVQPVDGVSILPVLRGRGAFRREAIFCHFPHYVEATGNLPACSVRRGDWKLIRFFADGPGQRDRFELYNLREDPGEQRDLAQREPRRIRELSGLIDRHLAEVNALVPRPNPAYRASVAGWTASADAQLEVTEGFLAVHSVGGDPHLWREDASASGGPFRLEVRARSRASGEARAYWTTDQGRAFVRERSIVLDLPHDGEWHEVSAALPATSILRVRLDPASAPGEIAIAWVRLRDARGEVVREWRV